MILLNMLLLLSASNGIEFMLFISSYLSNNDSQTASQAPTASLLLRVYVGLSLFTVSLINAKTGRTGGMTF